MIKLIMFVMFIVFGFKFIFADPLVIQETLSNMMFFGAGFLVLILGYEIVKEAIKG